MLGPRRHLLALFALIATLLLAARSVRAQGPLDPRAVPDALKPWTGWVLDGVQRCPTLHDHADQSRCAWPARIELVLGDHGGTFTQTWHVDATTAVALPGDAKRWPGDVKVDGKPARVVTAGGEPRVELAPGEHTLAGSFAWDSLPESLAVPKETGLLALTLRGAPVAAPNRDAQGTVWFQKAGVSEEGDALGVVVHRKVSDDIPLRLATRIELHVSGKSREELLGKALPQGFVPMSLESPLPARVEPDGRVRVQVRPGVFTLMLTARVEASVDRLTRPDPQGPWKVGDEVWVFEAKNDYRVVSVEGVASIDPQQTTLPDAWKQLPAYPMAVGTTMRFVETRRGDADPPPDQLALARTLWLDFDGQGYTAQDVITGTLNRESRLTMAPPTVLGRVAINGRDQFITTTGDASRMGVEVRQGNLSVTADSRIVDDPRDIPAVGWAHDFHQVQGTLHVPPGWTVLYATGVDDVPGTWLRHWSLMQIFLALMVGIVIGRLHGVGWGAVALLMLVLILPEAGAPEWCWIPLLALEALVRVLPAGAVRRLFEGARFAAFLIVAILVIPFAVHQVRQGLHPALLEPDQSVGSGEVVANGESVNYLGPMRKEAAVSGVPAQADMPAEAAPAASAAAAAGKGDRQRDMLRQPGSTVVDQMVTRSIGSISSASQSNAQVYDPAAIVQTGPGLPRWRWTTLDLRWSGPVASTQRLRLYLVSPPVNLVLALLRAALLFVVVLRLFPYSARLLPRVFGPRSAGAAVAVVLFGSLAALGPRPARADIPDKAMLDELKARLLRPAACSPSCASSGRMAVDLRGNALRLRVEIDAAATTAVPLPGTGAQWSPAEVRVDGQPARALARIDDVLWVALDAGSHQVVLEGTMPERASVQISLPLKPHRVEVSAVGWTVAGVHEDGLADDDVQFTRTEGARGQAGTALQPSALPPFVTVARTLHVGLDWEMDTQVTRVTPVGSAVVLEVPLLAGEQVTTADLRVAAGKAQVFLGPEATTVAWHSVLAQKSPITLTAPKAVAWAEVWRMDIGPIWNASYSGIPFVHAAAAAGTKVPEWRPWPGEVGIVKLTRPDGVAGQTLTIDESTTALSPGLRATDVTLTLTVRSSRGGEHTVTLPEGAVLESLSINGSVQPIRQDGRKVTVPVVPGAQTLALTFREAVGLGVLFESPAIDLGAPSVNATVTLAVPGGRWLLFAFGPRVGPAVLFWSLLLVLVVIAVALGKNRWTPLRAWHWALLFVGLSQVDVVAGLFFVGWLLALGYRARDERTALAAGWFNLWQIVLVGWTLAALSILAVSLYQGLLGSPEMQVMGNASSSTLLRWFTDRAGPALPRVSIVSVPLLVYRGAMLAWALWIVLSLLSWLRWGWASFTRGGGWRRGAPPRPPVDPAYGGAYHAPAPTAPAEVQTAAGEERAPEETAGPSPGDGKDEA
jgi:hypothetical protein